MFRAFLLVYSGLEGPARDLSVSEARRLLKLVGSLADKVEPPKTFDIIGGGGVSVLSRGGKAFAALIAKDDVVAVYREPASSTPEYYRDRGIEAFLVKGFKGARSPARRT